MMFSPSRDEARRFFVDTWRKYREEAGLSDLEKAALQILLLHPEYRALLESGEAIEKDFTPESGRMNPYLHLSLHLAVEEQLAIDQPPGIRGRYGQLLKHTGDEHAAKHAVLECLGETLWQAQRNGTGPDEKVYLECLDRQVEGL